MVTSRSTDLLPNLPPESLSDPGTFLSSRGQSPGRGGSGGRAANGDNIIGGFKGTAGIGGEEIGDEGIRGEGRVGAGMEATMELCSFCSEELFEPGLIVGSGRLSSLNLKQKRRIHNSLSRKFYLVEMKQFCPIEVAYFCEGITLFSVITIS